MRKVFSARLWLPLIAAVGFLLIPIPAQAAPAAIFTCTFGHRDTIDPIVAPGVYPTEHMHIEGGGLNWTPTSTSADLRAGGTTCAVSGDHAGYWIINPTLNGQYLELATATPILVYYNCLHSASICSTINWFPENFGEVAGNANATSVADNPAFNHSDPDGYRCTIGGGDFFSTPPATCTSGLIVLRLTYGNCRFPDGHTTFQVNSNCTGAGGTPQIRRQQYWRFDLPGTSTAGLMLDFDHPTYQLHADILDGFLPAYQDAFLNHCVRPKLSCGTNPQNP
jgi:uncharacterized protein DUF1996